MKTYTISQLKIFSNAIKLHSIYFSSKGVFSWVYLGIVFIPSQACDLLFDASSRRKQFLLVGTKIRIFSFENNQKWKVFWKMKTRLNWSSCSSGRSGSPIGLRFHGQIIPP